MHRHNIGTRQELVEGDSRLAGVGVSGDDLHPQALQSPAQCPPDGAQPDQPGRAPGELPGAEPLVRDRAVGIDPACTHIRVGAKDVAVNGEEEGDGHLGHGIGVACRAVQHRDTRRGGGRHIDVGGITAGGRNRHEWALEHRAGDPIGLHHQQIGPCAVDPLGKLGGRHDPQRHLVDPRVIDHLGQRSDALEALPPQR